MVESFYQKRELEMNKRSLVSGLSAGLLSAGYFGVRKWKQRKLKSQSTFNAGWLGYLVMFYEPALVAAVGDVLDGVQADRSTHWLKVWNQMVGLRLFSDHRFRDQLVYIHDDARIRSGNQVYIQVDWTNLKVSMHKLF